jgi:hypothetical protein
MSTSCDGMPYACAECGTTEATTYVVTTLDPEDPRTTRTEVCRACDDEIRLRPIIEAAAEEIRITLHLPTEETTSS